MEVLAVNTASPIQGALIMSALYWELFRSLALLVCSDQAIRKLAHSIFNKVAAISLVALALYSFNGVVDSHSRFKPWPRIRIQMGQPTQLAQANSGTQAVKINSFWIPVFAGQWCDSQTEHSGWTDIGEQDAYSCALSFILKRIWHLSFPEATDRQVFTLHPKGQLYFCLFHGDVYRYVPSNLGGIYVLD